ncbi:PE-PPE domain-containing protein [Mycobacterium sp. MMS18-G62]
MLALTSAAPNVYTLTAALYIVKGTNSAFNQIPDSAYPPFAGAYLALVGVPDPSGPGNPPVLVPYPAAFFPISPPGYIFAPTYDQSVAAGVTSLESLRPLSSTSAGDVLWGYSQGAAVVSQYKKDYNAAYPGTGTTPPVPPTFVLVANPNRPNGGILERGVALGTIPVLGVTFNGATPTSTAGVPDGTITTYDVARQYDGIADAPTNPLNAVADVNAIMGFALLHGQYPNADLSTAIDQGTFGDTQYYLIPTYPLPLLMPVTSVPLIGPIAADMLDPALRVLVEAGYDRTTSPGQPTPFNPLYFPDPTAFTTNLLVAVPTGLDNGLQDLGLGRAAGTAPVTNPFGVGGPAANTSPTPAMVSSTNEPAVVDPTPDTASPNDRQAGTSTSTTSVTTPQDALPAIPKPPTTLVSRPQPLLRGPIGGSPPSPGVDGVASSIAGVVNRTTTAISNAVGSVTTAAGDAVSAVSGGSAQSGASGGDVSH